MENDSLKNLGLSMQDILDYLAIDYTDDRTTKVLNRTLKTAVQYLRGSIGEDYPVDDPRAKELALILIDDLYSNHDINDKVSGNTRRLIDDFILQLKLELKRKKDEEG